MNPATRPHASIIEDTIRDPRFEARCAMIAAILDAPDWTLRFGDGEDGDQEATVSVGIRRTVRASE